MTKKILAILIMLSAVSTEAYRDTYFYSINPQAKLSAVIAESVASRIEFGLLGFREVIGDESKYTFITDHNHKNIFLTPKVPAGEHITLALVNKAGEIVDLVLSVQKTDSQVIKIDKKIFDQDYSTNKRSKEVISMIKAMQKDIDSDGKYYVLGGARDILHNIEGINLVQDRTYRFGELIGSRIVVTNLNKSIKELRVQNFRNLFEGSIAVSIQKKVLRPNEKCFVYTVAKEQLDD